MSGMFDIIVPYKNMKTSNSVEKYDKHTEVVPIKELF